MTDHPTDANPKGLKKVLTFDSAYGPKEGLSTAIRHQPNRRFQMTKAAAAVANVVVSLDTSVSVGRKSYKLSDLIAHTAKQYDTLYLLQEEQLGLFKSIGETLIAIRCLFGEKDDRAYGEWLGKTELGSMSRQDRADAMFIAANWTKVQKLNKDGKLDSLGVSAIRKRIKAAEAENQPKAASAGNTAKGKVKAAEQPKADAKPVAMTEEELAKQVYEQIKTYGLDMAKFSKALVAHIKAS